MAFFSGELHSRHGHGLIAGFTGILGVLFLLTAGCASRPPSQSLAPKLATDHGFPGVSVSEGHSQWPPAHGPEEESAHRIYSETPPPPPPTPAPTPVKIVPSPPQKPASSPLQKTVYFSFNSSRLSYWDEIVLNRLAKELKKTQFKLLLLHGSTDPLGSEAYNKKLGLRRSLAVKRYLISRGIPARKIRAMSWGDKKARQFSACRKKSHLCHSQSRSVRIDIIEEKTFPAP